MSAPRQLHLNLFGSGAGRHFASWRHPSTTPFQIWDLRSHERIGRLAERGRFDAVFLADSPALGPVAKGSITAHPEPITLLSAIAAVTEHLGLIATISTTYFEPYNAARQLASLDYLSGGRVGWNIVTGSQPAAAANFGSAEHPSHADRYERAEEFTEVVLGLLSGWEEGALVYDQASGVMGDPSKIHRLDHVGKHFSVAGPLNVPRSPQGRIVLLQAGSSDTGRAFSARYADGVFTAQPDIELARAFYSDTKRRVLAAGRDPQHTHVLPGFTPIIGSTSQEAQALKDELDQLVDPEVGLAQVRGFIGIELGGLGLHERIPAEVWDVPIEGFKSRVEVFRRIAVEEQLTVFDLLKRFSLGFGHHAAIGTPDQIADGMQRWFETGAADGFNLMPITSPAGLEAFVDEVVPILQDRGLYRREYDGSTLRRNYGLPDV